MDWDKEASLKLIKLYRAQPCLWDRNHSDYKNRVKMALAWNVISEKMKCDVMDAKKKLESLLASFRRERHKYRFANQADGKSTWFAFDSMTFLLEHFPGKKPANEEEPSQTNIEIRNEPVEIVVESDDSEVEESTNNRKEPSPPPSPPQLQRKRKTIAIEPRKVKRRFIEGIPAKRILRDGSAIFGEHVTSKLRGYSEHTRNVVEYLIGNILYKADMGQYEKQTNNQRARSFPTPTAEFTVFNNSQSNGNDSYFDPAATNQNQDESNSSDVECFTETKVSIIDIAPA